MDRSWVGVLFAILFAGGVQCDEIRDIVRDEGSNYTVSVMTFGHEVITCHLTTPHNEVFYFQPGDQSSSTDKYFINEGDTMIGCIVTIQNIDENDVGLWVMSYDQSNGDGRVESYNILISVVEPLLTSMINHFTRRGMSIDISLSKESFEEECYLRPPQGELIKLDEDFEMENVKVQSKSNFVSCRITIGPMTDELLGEWRLCGKSTEDEELRCQPANIEWNNDDNPDADWSTDFLDRFDHPVHFGGRVNPAVLGRGNAITCHVITPNGEDLVLTSDVRYPHIERTGFNRVALCSITFSDIDSSMIGNWTVYGKYRAATVGLHEIHLPLSLFIYDENNPYNQAYNQTVSSGINQLVKLPAQYEVEVRGSGTVDDCHYVMPSGEKYTLNDGDAVEEVVLTTLNRAIGCHIAIDPVTEEMVGEWMLVGKFSSGVRFTEIQQPFRVIEEDPANPIIEDFRTVENLESLNIVDTSMGLPHRVTIDALRYAANDGCHLLTPSGLQYAFIPGFNVPNVEILQQSGIQCGITIHVMSPDMIGEWTLIARATRSNVAMERRQSFTIRIEETSSIGDPISITEGADLYVRLPDETSLHDTCKLHGPNGEEFTDSEVDQMHALSCGFIVRNINHEQNGTWTIVYGDHITYKATLEVNVIGSVTISEDNLEWTLGTAVETTIGPEDAVYCRIEDPYSRPVYDRFGPCKIVVDRVTMEHNGAWTMMVAVEGAVLLQNLRFNVEVQPAATESVVTMSVVRNAPAVLLTCSVPIEYNVLGCKFRDPQNRILVASHGVGQGGYIFDRGVANYESDADSHDFTLRLVSPSESDIGIWRCAVDTDRGTVYGFATVTCPWLMENRPYLDFSLTEPRLTADSLMMSSVEGPMTLSCSINAPIRYCYFRARNGTVFSVGPSTSSPGYEYVGNGFHAGECGIRFNHLVVTDSGPWSCHVGLMEEHDEQTDSMVVQLHKPMTVNHRQEGNSMWVYGHVYDLKSIEYCRFVRIDGTGFTSDNVPPGYLAQDRLDEGLCQIYITNPTILDQYPWTIVAKLEGVDGEISGSTIDTLLITPPIDEDDGPAHAHPRSPVFLWVLVAMLCFVLSSAALALIPKKNREWTYERASHIRDSLRRHHHPKHTTPVDTVTDLPEKV